MSGFKIRVTSPHTRHSTNINPPLTRRKGRRTPRRHDLVGNIGRKDTGRAPGPSTRRRSTSHRTPFAAELWREREREDANKHIRKNYTTTNTHTRQSILETRLECTHCSRSTDNARERSGTYLMAVYDERFHFEAGRVRLLCIQVRAACGRTAV